MIEIKTQFIRNLILNKEYHRAVFHAEKLPHPLNAHHAFLLYFANYMVSLHIYHIYICFTIYLGMP